MSVRFQKLMTAAAVLAVAAFVAVGCGGSSGDGDGGDAKLAEKQELVVNMGVENEGGIFNPAALSSLDDINSKGFVQFAGLYKMEGQDSEIVPELATGAPKISEDGLTYTVELRDDAKWSDGEPIVAKDVVTAVEWTMDKENNVYFAEFLNGISKTEAVDDHTVRFTLSDPVPWFTQLLTLQNFYPLRDDQLQKLGAKYGQDVETAVSGPFKLVEYKPNERIVYEKNDEYFGADDVKLEKLTFRMVSNAKTASADFDRGKLDTGLQGTMYDSAEVSKWKADDRFVSGDSVSTMYMWMNTRSKETSDPKVRQALALAINRKDLVENVTGRGDTPSNVFPPRALPGSDVWAEGSQNFLSTNGEPDVDKAKSLLQQAGWDSKTVLNLIYASGGSGSGEQIAEQIQSNLKDAGVEVKLTAIPGSYYEPPGNGASPVDEKNHLVLSGWIMDYFDAQNYYSLLTSANVEAGLNSANYESEAYDQLYAEAIKTVDEDARFEIYKQLEAKISGPDGDMPAAPLYAEAMATLVQPWVQGFELTPSGVLDWRPVSVTERD